MPVGVLSQLDPRHFLKPGTIGKLASLVLEEVGESRFMLDKVKQRTAIVRRGKLRLMHAPNAKHFIRARNTSHEAEPQINLEVAGADEFAAVMTRSFLCRRPPDNGRRANIAE